MGIGRFFNAAGFLPNSLSRMGRIILHAGVGRLLRRWNLRNRSASARMRVFDVLALEFFVLERFQLQAVTIQLANEHPLGTDGMVLLYHKQGQQTVGDDKQHYQHRKKR